MFDPAKVEGIEWESEESEFTRIPWLLQNLGNLFLLISSPVALD